MADCNCKANGSVCLCPVRQERKDEIIRRRDEKNG